MLKFDWKNIAVIIFCLFMLMPHVRTYVDKTELLNHGVETMGIVISIRKGYRSRPPKAVVDYLVDGKNYQNEVPIKYNRTEVGAKLRILYNPDNPNKITVNNRKSALDTTSYLLLCTFLCVFCLFLHIHLGISNLKKPKNDLD